MMITGNANSAYSQIDKILSGSKTHVDERLKELADEDNRYIRFSKVFGSNEGIEVFTDLLEVCGYWRETINDERTMGKFELGRLLFNLMSVANLEVCHTILKRRADAVITRRMQDKVEAERNVK
jgi:hypothetical protein